MPFIRITEPQTLVSLKMHAWLITTQNLNAHMILLSKRASCWPTSAHQTRQRLKHYAHICSNF